MSTRIMVVAAAMLALGVGSAMANWSEDFNSYTDGQALNEGPNRNGWGAYEGVFWMNGFPEYGYGPYQISGAAIARATDVGGGDIRGACCGTTAAIADIPVFNGVAQLKFDYQAAGAREGHGLQLFDTRPGGTGGMAKVYTDFAGWFVEYTNSAGVHTRSVTADYGAYDEPTPQSVVLTLDYENNMMEMVASATDGVTKIYAADTLASQGTTLAIPDPDFLPNQILYFTYFSGPSQIDNIEYVPEPASLALLGLGGLLLARRHRR